MFNTDIGIDLGTASVLVFIKGKGVVLKEPSVVAVDRDTEKIKAVGEEARLMIGRTPENIVAVRPLKQGVISDYSITEQMIRYLYRRQSESAHLRNHVFAYVYLVVQQKLKLRQFRMQLFRLAQERSLL